MSKYYFHINQRLWHSLWCMLHFICTIEIVAYCHLLKFRTLHRFDQWRNDQISNIHFANNCFQSPFAVCVLRQRLSLHFLHASKFHQAKDLRDGTSRNRNEYWWNWNSLPPLEISQRATTSNLSIKCTSKDSSSSNIFSRLSEEIHLGRIWEVQIDFPAFCFLFPFYEVIVEVQYSC